MAFARTAATAALRRSVGTTSSRSARSFTQVTGQPIRRKAQPAFVAAVRWHSAPAGSAKVYDFSHVKKLSESPSGETILVDVREPSEYQAGHIPGAINLPIKSQPDALFLPEEEFVDRFGFDKPPMDKEVVFYCKAGVRSSAAAQLAQQQGYQNIAEYRGSWLDWEKNGGPTSKP
ncbi:hypothetical protein CKM354_000074900 [Cercospora kikuchii]|uniref:Rhodanese domain-containing protein n=1 Tax=Cercospora kikuchii TaxID=84275 RepID=A0A9P3C4G4_9PEZI|nr:uncharacterized protein CKM354_000074900 [Cercospora kikuchii]GIZ37299.1 hypothetical protein CKM354_000074900 [Cercospora kikuchii]